MAYNVSYSTLPTFNSNSIGYNTTTVSYNGSSNTWIQGNNITLTPGIYMVTGNLTSNSSYNTFSYIVASPPSSGQQGYIQWSSIWFSADGSTHYPMSSFNTFQGGNPSTSGVWNTFAGWFPVAGSHYVAPTNITFSETSAINLSRILEVRETITINMISYISSGGNHCTTLSVVRIS